MNKKQCDYGVQSCKANLLQSNVNFSLSFEVVVSFHHHGHSAH